MKNVERTLVTKVLVVLFFLLLAAVHARAAERRGKERLAVLDLEVKHGVETSFAEALSGVVRDHLHSYGDFQVLSREDIQAVAKREQLLQAVGCDDSSSQCLVDFGRALGSRYMVAGDISKIGSTYTLSLRMLDTEGENAGVINRVRDSCKCEEDDLIGVVEDLSAKLVGKPTSAMRKAEAERKKAAEIEKQRLAEEWRIQEEVAKANAATGTQKAAEQGQIPITPQTVPAPVPTAQANASSPEKNTKKTPASIIRPARINRVTPSTK